MSSVLTPQMIMAKAKCYDITAIKLINFWGRQLTDVSAINKCTSLESATFSGNLISTLRYFKGMPSLRDLSLANNLISDIREITYLNSCPNLTRLWLKDNPICDFPHYRFEVIKRLPGLIVLDDKEITDEEREIARTGQFGYISEKNEMTRNKIKPNTPFFMDKRDKYQMNIYDDRNMNIGRGGEQGEKRKYIGILPGMNGEDEDNNNNNINNGFGRYNRRRATDEHDGPGRLINKYGNINRGVTPFNNNHTYGDENDEQKYNKDNRYKRNEIPTPYKSPRPSTHDRTKYNYNNNPMEVSTSCGQTGVLECINTLLKGLSSEELIYIKEQIDKKIAKY